MLLSSAEEAPSEEVGGQEAAEAEEVDGEGTKEKRGTSSRAQQEAGPLYGGRQDELLQVTQVSLSSLEL